MNNDKIEMLEDFLIDVVDKNPSKNKIIKQLKEISKEFD